MSQDLTPRLPENVRRIGSSEARDHVINLSNRGDQCGARCRGPSVFSDNDYIPKVKEERLSRLLSELAKDADAIQQDLSLTKQEYVHSEGFAYLFERCFRGAVENYHEEKRRASRAILLNSLLPTALDEDRKLFYLVLVESLAPLHIRILKVLVDPVAYDRDTGGRVGTGGGLSTSRAIILKKLLPDDGDQLVQSAWNDLRSRGLLAQVDLGGSITDRGINQNGRDPDRPR